MVSEYLLKRDVMAALRRYGVSYARGSRAECAVNSCTEYTFPAPSLAVDAIDRAELLKRLKLHGYTQDDYCYQLALLMFPITVADKGEPAPSVDAPTPNRTDIDWQTKVTAAPLKLEAGKLYRTREGWKAFVSAIGKVAVGCIDGHAGSHDWYHDGKSYQHNKYDLISLWDEPTPESGITTVKIPSDGVVTKVSRSDGKTEYPNQKCSEYFKESGNSKLLEMVDKIRLDYDNHIPVRAADLTWVVLEIARLLAERGDK